MRELIERLGDCRPNASKCELGDERVTRVVKEGSSAKVRVGPIDSVIVEEGLLARPLVPLLPVLGVGFMNKYRINECRTVRESKEVHIITVRMSAEYGADDRSRFPFLPGILSRGRLGIDVVPPLRSLSAMHLLLNILLKIPKEWNQVAVVRPGQVLPMHRSSTNGSRSLFILRGGPS
jgi:hypothetical protein